MIRHAMRLVSETKGATAIEYGMICALIAMAAVGAIKTFASTSINQWYNTSNTVRANT